GSQRSQRNQSDRYQGRYGTTQSGSQQYGTSQNRQDDSDSYGTQQSWMNQTGQSQGRYGTSQTGSEYDRSRSWQNEANRSGTQRSSQGRYGTQNSSQGLQSFRGEIQEID